MEFVFKRRGVGAAAVEIHDNLYRHDPNGGPNVKTVHVHISNMNKSLRQYGFAIWAGKGTDRRYRVLQWQ